MGSFFCAGVFLEEMFFERKDKIMTLEELYGKVVADDELKEAFAEAAKDGKAAEWAAAQGVEATNEEIAAFVKGAAANEKLSVSDVDQVAGGGYWTVFKSVNRFGLC